MDANTVKIAVLESQIEGLREQHKEHKREITASLEAFKEVVSASIDGIRDDIKKIYEFINQSKGYLAAVVMGASVLGGGVVALVSKLLEHMWK